MTTVSELKEYLSKFNDEELQFRAELLAQQRFEDLAQ